MQRFVIILSVLFAIVSCENNEVEQLEGEFLYYDNAAVLQSEQAIYGINLDEGSQKLIKQAKGYKKSPMDFVPVIIKGVKIPKETDQEGWDTIVYVKEVIAVMHPKENTKENATKVLRPLNEK